MNALTPYQALSGDRFARPFGRGGLNRRWPFPHHNDTLRLFEKRIRQTVVYVLPVGGNEQFTYVDLSSEVCAFKRVHQNLRQQLKQQLGA